MSTDATIVTSNELKAGCWNLRLLFITWDGPQVSYLESLFLPIFQGLRSHGIETSVLQFGWGDEARTRAIGQACEQAGIGYGSARVLRQGGALGAAATAVAGARHVRGAVGEFRPDVIMPRSHMPALAVLAAGGERLGRICFDADGLPSEERAEFAGLKHGGPVYRALNGIESAMIRRSESVLVRSSFAARHLAERTGVPAERFHVVTNGRDPAAFAPGTEEARRAVRSGLGIPESAPLLVYAGSIGPQYGLDRILSTASAVHARRSDARLLILTGSPDAAAEAIRGADLALAAVTTIRQLPPDQVPGHLAAADAGLCFRARTLSTQAVAPVKLGEYLLCGLPVIGTEGIGDTGPAAAAGVFMDEAGGPEAAADWLLTSVIPKRESFRAKARRVGLDHFSLARSVADYAAALGLT